ncbi:MAG: GTPase ObgE [Bacteroidales bacterium]|nr:GTPase ObgE [Bacteroidales bacterium]
MEKSNFVDFVKIYMRSGKGGAGSVHFRREKFVPKGGPDGGDGGRGGHIILRGSSQLWTLLHLKYNKHIIAENGRPGGGSQSTGASGKDRIIEVPLGTVAKKADSSEKICEVVKDGEEKILLEGGKGGLGNAHFKSPTNQTPRTAQPGEEGQEGWYILELKILADVGLVGYPNAGKSTLLSSISAAKPKIADYPFTTLEPNLGLIKYREDKSFVMADIPGIIENAHQGKGLGLRFLRHIERNSVLLFMVPSDSKNIREEYNTLFNELKQYNPELLDKQRILAVSKSDLLDRELMELMEQDLPDLPYVFISSVTNYGISRMKDLIWEAINQ